MNKTPERFWRIYKMATSAKKSDKGISLDLLEASGKYVESCHLQNVPLTAKELLDAIEQYQKHLSILEQAVEFADLFFTEQVQRNVNTMVKTAAACDLIQVQTAVNKLHGRNQ